jgi:tRNA-guanine family transglycosylase
MHETMPSTLGFSVLAEDSGPEDRASPSAGAGPRLGVASLPNQKTLHTPCLLVYAGRGCARNVTWDALQRIGERISALDTRSTSSAVAYQLDVLQLIHQQANIRSFLSSSRALSQPVPTARAFLGVPDDNVLVATPRNPTSYDYVGMTRQSTDERASFMTSQGAAWMAPEEYMETACAVGADIVVALGDEVVADARVNRLVESSKRTIVWMQRALSWLEGRNQLPFLLCPIVGGGTIDKRRDAIKYMPYVQDPRVHGVYVSGLGTGESVGIRQEILREVVARVPKDKLRMVSGVSNPIEILEAVRCGVDVFDAGFVDLATRAGLALCFPTDADGGVRARAPGDPSAMSFDDSDATHAFDCAGYDGMKINLWADSYKLDRSPLVDDCLCPSCQEHSRGYIHHLLVTHEMTAHVLLEQHNIFHMLRFFTGVRSAIRDGRFEQYREALVNYAQRWQRG